VQPSRPRRGSVWALFKRGALLAIGLPPLVVLAFRFVDPPMTPLMAIRWIEGYGVNHRWVAYADIAPSLMEAVIAAEDNWFCDEQFGFDFPALGGEVEAWWDGERPRGASTITMQTAKNLLLWPGRDPVRKALEAWLTPQLALLWPKRRVLEVYLNIIEFGPGIYGAESAARAFFRKSAADLSSHQAALLASVLPRPLVWSAAAPSAYLRQRATAVERRMAQIRHLLACVR
jgi:monofunctional biosynthetic peptidoglycan transglycosylase